nr:hypothetical protein [Tanacetum cinerariifolium]
TMAKVKKVDDEVQIQALVDGKRVNIKESSIRRTLRHKEMYVISSHTKKIFANIRKIGVGFSRAITSLFDSMMAQAAADIGDIPVETHQTPIVDPPSTSQPQKPHKPRRRQRKEPETSHDVSADEDHIPSLSSDPLSSAKDALAKEIAALKKKVSKLNKWRKSRSGGLRRLKRFGLGRRVKSPMEKDDNQVEGMARHKEMYVISSHTKKIFANIRKIGVGFSRAITSLFDSMMAQAAADIGDIPVETHQTPIVDPPSTSQPQKPHKPRRRQRKEPETSHDVSADEDHIPSLSSDPLSSGEDISILNELMVFCTSLQE